MKKLLSLFIGILFLISTSLYASDWRIESPWTKSGTTISQSTPGDNVNINATFGAELSPAYAGASGVNWTLGAGWETPIAGGVLNKNADGVGTATPTGATAIVVGVTYKVVITPNITVETFSYTLGEVLGSSIVGVSVITDYITAITTGNLIITPTNLSRGTVTVSWKALTNATGDLTVEGNLNVRSPSTFDSQITLKKGQLLLPDGLVGAPTLAFANNPTTGIWNAAGSLRFSMGGSGLGLMNTDSFYWYGGQIIANKLFLDTGNLDVQLVRDAANTLALRNGVNAQQFNWYATYTDAANYEGGYLTAAAGSVTLGARTLGTGTDNQDLLLIATGTGAIGISSTTAVGALAGTLTNSVAVGNPAIYFRIKLGASYYAVPGWLIP